MNILFHANDINKDVKYVQGPGYLPDECFHGQTDYVISREDIVRQ